MSNVLECIELYLTDDEVTDAQFRAVILDAQARDLISGTDALTEMRKELQAVGSAVVLLNRVDNVRRDQVEALDRRCKELTGFIDSLAGQVRVLRERLDNMEGK